MIINKGEFDERWHNSVGVPDSVEFGIVNRRKGIINVVFPDEAKKIKSQQRRWQKPKPPPIQELLKKAQDLSDSLARTPGLTRDALAKKVGIDPSYLTRILNLLNLAPEIQRYLLMLPPTQTKGLLVESRLKHLARIRDHQTQLIEFEKLKNRPIRQSAVSA
jgi:hypothetical protein